MNNNKNTYAILFVIIIFVFTINLISFKNGHNWGGDFADYINFAKGIVNGNVDEIMSISKYRVENSNVHTGSANTYWGLPFLLAPVYYILGLDIHIFKICVYIFFIFSLFAIYLLFKDRLNNSQNLLLVAIVGFNPFFFDFKENIVSDIPYFFFSLLSLFLIKRFVILKEVWLNRHASYFLLGLIIFLSSLMRPVGIVLLPALLFVQYSESRASHESIKDFIVSDKSKYIPYVMFIILSVVMSWILPIESVSKDSSLLLNIKFSNILFNAKYHLAAPSRFLPYFDVRYSGYGLGYDKIHLILYVIVLSGAILGVIRNIKDDYLFVVYMLLNFILFLIAPGRSPRFFMPLFPFFIYFLLSGLSNISISFALSDKNNIIRVSAAYLLGAGLLITSMLYISNATYKNIAFNKTQIVDGPYTPDSIELFNYIKENTDKDDSIIFHKSRVMLLYTDRKSFAMGSQNFTPEKAFNSDAKYVAISKKKYVPHDLTLEDFQGRLDCEFENKSFLLCNLKKNSNR